MINEYYQACSKRDLSRERERSNEPSLGAASLRSKSQATIGKENKEMADTARECYNESFVRVKSGYKTE